MDLRYQVDVVRPDGALAYTEFHDLHARGPSDWIDVIVGYDGGEPCAAFFPAQSTPDVEVADQPFCTPLHRIGELRRYDGSDALQIGFLPEGRLTTQDGVLPTELLTGWRSIAESPSMVPLPPEARGALGPSPGLPSPTYLAQVGRDGGADDRVQGARGAAPAVAPRDLVAVDVPGAEDARLLTHREYGFPVVGELQDLATGATLRVTATLIRGGSSARDVQAP